MSEKTEVTLEEEINHIKNYIALSEIRYGNQLILHLDVPEELFDCKIPAMLIQTFVENSVKHEMNPEEVLHIWVKVKEKDKKMYIAVEDSGQGFEEEILEKLRKGEPVIHNGMEHFGIANVKRRLNIIYGNAAKIYFSNEKNGTGNTGNEVKNIENKAKGTENEAKNRENKAKVEIELPFDKKSNKEAFAEWKQIKNIDKNECDNMSQC